MISKEKTWTQACCEGRAVGTRQHPEPGPVPTPSACKGGRGTALFFQDLHCSGGPKRHTGTFAVFRMRLLSFLLNQMTAVPAETRIQFPTHKIHMQMFHTYTHTHTHTRMYVFFPILRPFWNTEHMRFYLERNLTPNNKIKNFRTT